jgi:HAD superfamily hydrolase (TIGR01509 family)
MIQALVFDFDGLIVDTETPLFTAWEAVHSRRGVSCDRTLLFGAVGHVGIDFDPWVAFGPQADRQALEQEYRSNARTLTWSQPPLPGVEALLADARRRGLALGVASNSTHAHVEGHLARIGLLAAFDAIRCIDDVPAGKPAPDVYLSVLAALDAEPRRTIAFEDSVPGHVAAKRAGLHCVVVPNPSTAHCDFPHADWKVPSLAETSIDALTARFTPPSG